MKSKILVIASLILISLAGSTATAQSDKDTCLCLTQEQKATLAQALNELDFKRQLVDSQAALIQAQGVLIENKNSQISLQAEIIRTKESIIRKFETTPIPKEVIKIGWKWYEITGAIIFSSLLGFSVGKWIAK